MEYKLEPSKKVITYDPDNEENGFLIEISKKDRFTTSYLSAIYAHCFKGYHLHRQRAANYVCIKGKIKVITFEWTKETGVQRVETVLDSTNPVRMNIPINIPTGLINEWEEEAWIINTPDIPYDPLFKTEQEEYSEEECLNGDFLYL